MTTSRGIRVSRGTRQRWLEENQGRHFCHCGCGEAIPLRLEHFNVGVPKYVHGHNSKGRPRTRPPAVSVPCACECGQMTTPGRRFINGHNGRGQKRSVETRRKIGAALSGEGNGNFGKIGPASPTWKGGRLVHKAGYILRHCPEHPFAVKRYVMEHRLIYEAWLREHEPESPLLVEVEGERYLRPEIEVHHRDEDKSHNVIENLQPMTKAEHARHHYYMMKAQGRPDGSWVTMP